MAPPTTPNPDCATGSYDTQRHNSTTQTTKSIHKRSSKATFCLVGWTRVESVETMVFPPLPRRPICSVFSPIVSRRGHFFCPHAADDLCSPFRPSPKRWSSPPHGGGHLLGGMGDHGRRLPWLPGVDINRGVHTHGSLSKRFVL